MQSLHPTLGPLVQTIESVVYAVVDRHAQLRDRDVEWVYGEYLKYFRATGAGREVPEPTATGMLREKLLADIWEELLNREEQDADDDLIGRTEPDPAGRPIPNLERLYIIVFSFLRDMVRTYHKRGGYLTELRENHVENLAEDDADDWLYETEDFELDHLWDAYGVEVLQGDRADPETSTRAMRNIADEKAFRNAAEEAGFSLRLHRHDRPEDGLLYYTDFLDFSAVAIRLAALRGQRKEIFRLVEDLVLVGLPERDMAELYSYVKDPVLANFPTDTAAAGPFDNYFQDDSNPLGAAEVLKWALFRKLGEEEAFLHLAEEE
ncbi:hypothetical protein [Lewinella sp. IMCC34191]|uniref:hypothetical protein n=1 Tax=Lewinella sp. IMCC34191 TaxID=2259172 RepID=UPI000E24870D|nr:hypothetical protein [Lewinella sp. IMCC34191]